MPSVDTTPETKIMHDEAGTDPDVAGHVNATKEGTTANFTAALDQQEAFNGENKSPCKSEFPLEMAA